MTAKVKPFIATSTVNGEIFRPAGISPVGLHEKRNPLLFCLECTHANRGTVLLFGGAPPLNCGSPTFEEKASFSEESFFAA
jgi:hypothetical protein